MRRQSASDIIVEDIKNAILEQKLKAGDKLPTERELAEQYTLSRIPVREALKTLAQMGLVESKHGKGTFVKEPDSTPIIDSLLQPMLTGSKAVLELMALRKLIETQGAREAALLRTEQELENIRLKEQECRQHLDQMNIGMLKAFQTSDYAFHLAIAEASKNTLFRNFLQIIEKTLRLHQVYGFMDNLGNSLDMVRRCHMELVDAIAARDARAAGEAMERHLGYVEKILAQHYNGKAEATREAPSAS